MTETGVPVFMLVGATVDWRVNVVALVNVTCTVFPCRLFNCKPPLLVLWIVPEAAVRQFVVVVFVALFAEPLALVLALPQAASSVASRVIEMRENNLFIIALRLRKLSQFPHRIQAMHSIPR
jgi:hypothetical protein